MNQNFSRRSRGTFVFAAMLMTLLSVAPSAEGQSRGRQDRVSNASYQRMRQFARRLDELAREANRQAHADQAGYRGIRRDTKFLRSIDHFAKRARDFRARMETYRARAWNVDEEVEHLLRDARNVQERIERARFADARTRRDWAEVVQLLDRVRDEYLYGGRSVRNDRGYRYPDSYGRDDDGYGYGSADLRQLAYELDQRAARASDLAGRYGTYGRYDDYSDLRRFSDQARSFRTLVDQNRLTRSQLRSEVNELLEEADDAYDDLRRTNVSRELSDEWSAVVQILNRMREIVAA